MTDVRANYLAVFLKEWELYRQKGICPSAEKSERPADGVAFDAPVKVGEIRVFADSKQALIGLVLADQQAQGYLVVPVSEFTVPATEQEILIGERVFQLWNSSTLASDFVRRSWLVATLSEVDLRHIASALEAVLKKSSVPAELLEFTALPIVKSDDPRLDYEREFSLAMKETEDESLTGANKSTHWKRFAYGLAASFIIIGGVAAVIMSQNVKFEQQCDVPREVEQIVSAPAPAPEPASGPVAEPVSEPEPATPEAVAESEPEPEPEMETPCAAPRAELQAKMGIAKKAAVKGNRHLTREVKCADVGCAVPCAEICCKEPRIASISVRKESLACMDGLACKGGIESDAAEPDVIGRERYAEYHENEFLETKVKPLSTFGLDVDTASYSTFRRYVTDNHRLPPRDSVRLEEWVNYFNYSYSGPTGEVPIAVTCELAECPWQAEHKLLRVALKAKDIAKDKLPPSNFVFLLDCSGSMDWNGGFEIARSAMKLLVNELRPEDSVAIVTYASGTEVKLKATRASDKHHIFDAINDLRVGGSTSGGAGIELAYQEAKKNFDKKANNRVILVTDGDFNVGVQSTQELVRMIEDKRKSGVFLSVLGVGRGNYRDEMMKRLANAGNGNYAFIDSILEAKKVLMTEFGGSMYTIAKDVKLQLEFNPAYASAYRLLGYECRKLEDKDFNDDRKDSGEMGVGHTMTAFYEIIPVGVSSDVAKVDPLKYQKSTPVKSGELLTVKLRYKEPTGDKSRLVETPVVAEAITLKDGPSLDFRFASSVAELALLLEDSKFKGSASIKSVLQRARGAKGSDDNGYRAEFIRLVESVELYQGAANPKRRHN